jgi:hypothetical protein
MRDQVWGTLEKLRKESSVQDNSLYILKDKRQKTKVKRQKSIQVPFFIPHACCRESFVVRRYSLYIFRVVSPIRIIAILRGRSFCIMNEAIRFPLPVI